MFYCDFGNSKSTTIHLNKKISCYIRLMIKSVKVKKYSGELVDFDEGKLRSSLKNANADQELINSIIYEIEKDLFHGITTKKIYDKAFKLLKSKKA